jgi:hypothetical protein
LQCVKRTISFKTKFSDAILLLNERLTKPTVNFGPA